MTFTASGISYLSLRDILQNDTAIDFLADTFKAALFTNSLTTPNYDTITAYAAAPFNANEVGTPSGGVALASPTITVQSGSVLTFDANDTAWGSQTISNARGALIYDDTITTPVADPAIAGVTFGADFSVTSGILTIQWAAGGILTIDLP
jgi:hypothetical protein